MQPFSDYYRTLQVHHEAGQEVIEAAYKRLCRIYHPDVNRDPRAGLRMQEINAAYEVLGDRLRRGIYHRQWLAAAAASAAAQAKPRPQPAPKPQSAPADPHERGELAQRALDSFFRSLMDGRWDDAYMRLTSADRKNVPAADFREWKKAVANSYTMGSYAIKLFRRLSNCTISGVTYRDVFEFSVFVCDMDARTGQVSEVNYLKYVAQDAGNWRVCLGYEDVKPLILRFKYMAEDAALLDPAAVYAEAVMNRDRHTGLLSRQGFAERAEYEAVRSRRYGNIFTLALLQIHPVSESQVFTDRDYARMCIVHAAKTIGALIRQTDIFARWGDNELAILFTETPRENAGFALEKLLEGLKRNAELEYGVTFGLAEFDGGQFEDTMAAAASDAQVRVLTSDGVTRTFVTVNDPA